MCRVQGCFGFQGLGFRVLGFRVSGVFRASGCLRKFQQGLRVIIGLKVFSASGRQVFRGFGV